MVTGYYHDNPVLIGKMASKIVKTDIYYYYYYMKDTLKNGKN